MNSTIMTLPSLINSLSSIEDSFKPKLPSYSKINLKKMHKKNERLLKKIEKTLDFFKLINETTVEKTEQRGVIQAHNQPLLRELSPGRFQIVIPPNMCLKKERKDNTSEAAFKIELQKAKEIVLNQLPLWNRYSMNNKKIIEALMNYKQNVKKVIKIFREIKNPYEDLYYNLHKFKTSIKSEKHKIPPYSLHYQRNKSIIQDPSSSKEYIKFIGGNESIWSKNEYFAHIPKTIIDDLKETNNIQLPSMDIKFLSLYGINRLLAITKMINYCQEFKIDYLEFQSGRTKQRITALNSHCKLLIKEHKIFHNKNLLPEISENTENHPSLHDLDYLLGLDMSKLDETIEQLKAIIQSPVNTNPSNEELSKEITYYNYLRSNNEGIKKLVKKIQLENEPVDQYANEAMIEKYLSMIPKIIKKREMKLDEENRIIKKMEIIEQSSTARSYTHQTENGYVDEPRKNLCLLKNREKSVFEVTKTDKDIPKRIFRFC